MIVGEITLQEKLDIVSKSLYIYPNESIFFIHLYQSRFPSIKSEEVHTKVELLKRLERLINEGDSRFDCISLFIIKETRELHDSNIVGGSTALSTVCNVALNCSRLFELKNKMVIEHDQGFTRIITTAQRISEIANYSKNNAENFNTVGTASEGNLVFKDSIKVFKVVKQLF